MKGLQRAVLSLFIFYFADILLTLWVLGGYFFLERFKLLRGAFKSCNDLESSGSEGAACTAAVCCRLPCEQWSSSPGADLQHTRILVASDGSISSRFWTSMKVPLRE